jgi:hypothetical protein
MDNMEQESFPMGQKIREILVSLARVEKPDLISAYVADLVRFAAEPGVKGETVDAKRARAAKRLGLSQDRVAKIWYGRAKVFPTHETNRIRVRAEAHLERMERQWALERQIETLGRQIEDLGNADVA